MLKLYLRQFSITFTIKQTQLTENKLFSIIISIQQALQTVP